jgi:NAD(P)-dependent dehydrogenase (short-subunit alcohol dehydrogenase family)
MGLQGTVALVTGAARGIGAAIAWRLAADGAKVALADLDLVEAEIMAAERGAGTIAVLVDVRSWPSVQSVAGLVESELGPVDALVNKAGISRVAVREASEGLGGTKVVDVNLTGT